MALKPLSLKELKLKIKYFVGSLFYLTYAPYALIYSRKRDRVEREYLKPPTEQGFDQPGKLLQAEQTTTGAYFYFEQAELEVSFLTTDFVRLNWQPGLAPIPYGITRHDWPSVTTQFEGTENEWRITSDQLQVIIYADGRVTFCDRNGQVLRSELPPQRKPEGWKHQAQLRAEERIYGLGERSFPLNLRRAEDENQQPHAFRMWNYDAAGQYAPGSDPMYISIPVYLGLHGDGSYLIFYENSFESTFTFSDVAIADFTGGSLRYYFAAGSPATVIDRYTELTGRAPLPPQWALGYHQSHWGYRTEEAIRAEAQAFQEYNLPLSAIHLDIDVQVGYRAFTIDPDRFPKLASFTKELAELGVKFITILNPGIKYSPHNNLFLEGRILEAFCKLPNGELAVGPVWPGWCVFPDFTKPVVRKWWSRQYEYLLDVGVAGFWHDMNEPAVFITSGDRSLPKVTQHYMEGRGGDHREAHNIYGLLQAQAAYESLCTYRPHQRPFIVSRAGWAGLQRYAWTWTGDIECTWAALRITISTVIGLGLSGVPYSGPDIGGFQGNPSAELYLRWFQMATFFTFCRTHSSNNVENRAPWTYGEPYLTIIRQFLHLRYRLMPYFYTLTWQAAQNGSPPVRPVFWADPSDARLWDIDDGFLLGDSLLIYPILEPEARSRSVILPQGHWYHFWNESAIAGGIETYLDAPLQEIPILVKAGTILPMTADNELILHIYAPVEGTHHSLLYRDAGDGYTDSSLEKFQIQLHEDTLTVDWETQGTYPFAYANVQIHLHGFEVEAAWIDEEVVNFAGEWLSCDRFQQLRVVGKLTAMS